MSAPSSRRRAKALLAALAVLLCTTLQLGSAKPAAAATVDAYTPQTVLGPGVPPSGIDQNVVELGSVSLAMTSTQTAYVVAVLTVNQATIRTLIDNEVRCFGPGGWTKNMVAGQNVYEASLGAPWNQVTQTTRYLVHPGVAGTVTCKGYIRTASLGYDDSTVRVASGEIRFADATIANQTNGQPIQASVATGLNVNSSTRTAREPATGMFDLAPGFAGLSVFGDTEFQVCAKGFPCNATSTASTTAQFTLYVNQWKTDGSLCHTQTATVRRTVPYPVHHIMIPLHVPNFTVATGNNCMPRFNAYVKTDWISGEPALVQGVAKNLPDSRGSTAVHNSDFGHVFAVPYA